jgi:hypothetical protein
MPTNLRNRWALLAFGVLGCNAVLGLDERTLVEAGASSGSSGSATAGSVGQSGASSGATSGQNTSGSMSSTGAVAGAGMSGAVASGSMSSGSASGAGTGSGVGTTGAAAGTGSTSGSGSASGSNSGTASGSSGATPTNIQWLGTCPAACTTATGCPTGGPPGTATACLVPAASPVPPVGLDGVMPNLLLPPYAVDGVVTTRYTSGADMVPGDYFAFDMCQEVSIDGVNLLTAPAATADVTDVPQSYAIQVSVDGTTWAQVTASTTPPAAQAMIMFAATTARYVMIIQTGTSAAYWWSIHEISPLCSSSSVSSGSTSGAASGSVSGASSGTGIGSACLTTTALPLMSAVASSTEDETDAGTGGINVAANAIDGNFDTRWGSLFMIDPSWIYADFGAEVSLSEVDILWEGACAAAYDIQLSDDTMTWTTVRAVTGTPPTWDVPPPGWVNAAGMPTADTQNGLSGVGRYLRIYGTSRCLALYGYSIWEMRAFGDTNASCTP